MDFTFQRHRIDITETGRQQPARIERSGHGQRAGSGPGKPKRRIIGRVAHQQNRLAAGILRRRQRDANQFPADPAVLVRGPHRKRPEQMSRAGAGKNRRHPHRGDDFAPIRRDEGEPQVMRSLFAHPLGGAHEASGPEGFFIDVHDGCVMRRVFGEKDKILDEHGEFSG